MINFNAAFLQKRVLFGIFLIFRAEKYAISGVNRHIILNNFRKLFTFGKNILLTYFVFWYIISLVISKGAVSICSQCLFCISKEIWRNKL